MSSQKSETQINLIALINSLDGIEAAILKERILTAAHQVTDDPEMVRRALKDSIISPELYINTMQKVCDVLETN